MQWASSMATKLSGQRGRAATTNPAAALADQPLGRDIEQPIAALAQPGDHRRAARPAPCALLKQAAGTPLATSVSTWSFISEISGEIDQRQPVAHERRRLEAERLAAAGRQHDQRVAAVRGRRPSLRAAAGGRRCSPSTFEEGGKGLGHGTESVDLVRW